MFTVICNIYLLKHVSKETAREQIFTCFRTNSMVMESSRTLVFLHVKDEFMVRFFYLFIYFLRFTAIEDTSFIKVLCAKNPADAPPQQNEWDTL